MTQSKLRLIVDSCLHIDHSPADVIRLRKKESVRQGSFLLLIGFFFSICGAAIISLDHRRDVICDRIEPKHIDCKIISSSLIVKEITKINQVKHSEAKVVKDSNGKKIHEVYLISDFEKVAIQHNDNQSSSQDKSEQINQFIDNLEKNKLTITKEKRILGYLGGLLFISIGVLIKLSALIYMNTIKRVYIFDHKAHTLRIFTSFLFFRFNRYSYSLEGSTINLEEFNIDRFKIFKGCISLSSGKIVNLFFSQSPEKVQEKVKCINQFLHKT